MHIHIPLVGAQARRARALPEHRRRAARRQASARRRLLVRGARLAPPAAPHTHIVQMRTHICTHAGTRRSTRTTCCTSSTTPPKRRSSGRCRSAPFCLLLTARMYTLLLTTHYLLHLPRRGDAGVHLSARPARPQARQPLEPHLRRLRRLVLRARRARQLRDLYIYTHIYTYMYVYIYIYMQVRDVHDNYVTTLEAGDLFGEEVQGAGYRVQATSLVRRYRVQGTGDLFGEEVQVQGIGCR